MMAAWTPDAPDSATADSPSALIAAGQPGFDPETLDHFEQIPGCPAVFVAVRAPDPADPDVWQRIELRCAEDDGHFPDTPHRAEWTWGAAMSLPTEPECPRCADVGVNSDGDPCTCPAGDVFAEAVRLRQNSATPDGDPVL